jgi:hypothetical protein
MDDLRAGAAIRGNLRMLDDLGVDRSESASLINMYPCGDHPWLRNLPSGPGY